MPNSACELFISYRRSDAAGHARALYRVLLLRTHGWPKVERMLQIIDAIEAAGIDAVEVSPDHWRHVHNRLAAGERPRPYSPAQHRAWLKRRSVQP